jgi:hypothetical protein
MTENAMEQVVEAIATIQPYAVLDEITIAIEPELKAHPKLLNSSPRPTGREILVVRILYDRSPKFLNEQLARMAENESRLLEALAMARAEKAELEAELVKLDAPN